MKRVLVSSVCILICLLLTGVKCQEDEEDEEDEGSGSWNRMWEIWRNFYKKVSDVIRKAWKEFSSEIKDRAADFRGWTTEAWESFKQKMNEWVNERNDIDESEKSEMRRYIERLQMPKDEEQE